MLLNCGGKTMDLLGIQDFILQKGFLTGSRAWGVENKGCIVSDYDYVLYGEDFYSLLNEINKNNIKSEKQYNNSILLYIENKSYNIFTGVKEKVENIKTTTEIMKSFPKKKIKDKKNRVYIFENIMSILKNL